jgi:hypothetical protein
MQQAVKGMPLGRTQEHVHACMDGLPSALRVSAAFLWLAVGAMPPQHS